MLSALLIVFREVIEAGLIVGIVLAATKGVPRRAVWGFWRASSAEFSAQDLSRHSPANSHRCSKVRDQGIIQHQHPAARGSDAHLAQCVDGESRARHDDAAARRGRRRDERQAHALRACDRGRRRGAARGIGGRAVPLRHCRPGRHLERVTACGRRARACCRSRRLGAYVFRAACHPDLPVVRGDVGPHHAARRRHGPAQAGSLFLQQGGYFEVFTRTIWDTSWLLSQDSIAGRLLHTLVGYSDAPDGRRASSLMQPPSR